MVPTFPAGVPGSCAGSLVLCCCAHTGSLPLPWPGLPAPRGDPSHLHTTKHKHACMHARTHTHTPVKYTSASTPLKTPAPEPGQAAMVVTVVSSVQVEGTASLTWTRPRWAFTRPTSSDRVAGLVRQSTLPPVGLGTWRHQYHKHSIFNGMLIIIRCVC